MCLNRRETEVILWYRTLRPLERRVVDHWLMTGDARLLFILRKRSKRLQRFRYLSVPHGGD